LPYHGWHESYLEAIEDVEKLGLVLPPDGAARRRPRLKGGVVLSDESKDETTSLDERALRVHGDACALEMEGYGFALACESARKTPWLVFRGIADFGMAGLRRLTEPGPDAEESRPKDWQLTATLAAGSAMLTWVTKQLYFFDPDRSPQ
jgi:hypothetical protein